MAICWFPSLLLHHMNGELWKPKSPKLHSMSTSLNSSTCRSNLSLPPLFLYIWRILLKFPKTSQGVRSLHFKALIKAQTSCRLEVSGCLYTLVRNHLVPSEFGVIAPWMWWFEYRITSKFISSYHKITKSPLRPTQSTNRKFECQNSIFLNEKMKHISWFPVRRPSWDLLFVVNHDGAKLSMGSHAHKCSSIKFLFLSVSLSLSPADSLQLGKLSFSSPPSSTICCLAS